jgi:hypothetical protein
MGDYHRMVNSRSVLICAVLGLAACHGDSGSTPVTDAGLHPKRPPAVKRGPSPEELTAGMVEAVTTGKSSVPVAVKFDLPQKPIVGQPTQVTIAVMPQIEADPATLVVTGSDAMALAPGSGPIEIPAVEPTQVYRHNIELTPTVEGVQLLGLSVTLKHDEISETREFSVPIIVAPADAGAAAEPKRAGLKPP